ncbi:MAG: hypothetical protein IIB05_10760, partial [Bacteroidetes bacterium]|nr:hypothetical protein [Bacteroidota bacterium]
MKTLNPFFFTTVKFASEMTKSLFHRAGIAFHVASFCLLPFAFSYSQAPQGFNYQAVARDGNNAVLANTALEVKIGLLQGSETGTLVWEEIHLVTTNDMGLFTLKIGDTDATNSGGTAAAFSDIDWNSTTHFINVQVDAGSDYVDMGTTQLLSVPYALSTSSVSDLKTLNILGPSDQPADSALFEVKNKDGQTVFAVYNEGVRIYVDTSGTKGLKGGFAVGGFSSSKGSKEYFRVTPDSVRIYVDRDNGKGLKGGFVVGGYSSSKGAGSEYFRVTPDSVRIYLDTTNAKGRKGGFAVGGYSPGKGAGEEFLRVSADSVRVYIDDSSSKGLKGGFAVGGYSPGKGLSDSYFNISGKSEAEIIDPSDSRILWYPKKEAFLTGRVLIESPDSVGTNSIATGYESKAIGNWSQALGYQTIARGDYSTSIGKNSVTQGINTFAFGNQAQAIYTFIVDRTDPTIIINSPADNASSDVHTSFVFDTNDNLDPTLTCTLYIDNTARITQSVNNNQTANFSIILPMAQYTWYLTCFDDAGNSQTTIQRNLNVTDLSGPDIVSDITYVARTEAYPFDVNVTDISGVNNVNLWFDGSQLNVTNSGDLYSSTIQTTLANALGNYTLTINANDTLGNDGTLADVFTLVQGYIVTLNLNPNSVTEGNNVDATGTVTLDDGSLAPESQLTLFLPSGSVNVTITNGTYSHSFIESNAGTYEITSSIVSSEGFNHTTSQSLTVNAKAGSSSSSSSSSSSGGGDKSSLFCGDGMCTTAMNENCNSCAADCGVCPVEEAPQQIQESSDDNDNFIIQENATLPEEPRTPSGVGQASGWFSKIVSNPWIWALFLMIIAALYLMSSRK